MDSLNAPETTLNPERWDRPRFRVRPSRGAAYACGDWDDVAAAPRQDPKATAMHWGGRRYVAFNEGDYRAMEVDPR